jgi:hypothetical protein
MKVHSLPERVVTGIERAAVGIELVRKDKLKLRRPVCIRVAGVCARRRVIVDQLPLALHARDVARRVGTQIQVGRRRRGRDLRRMPREVGYHGIASTAKDQSANRAARNDGKENRNGDAQEHDDANDEQEEAPQIGQASPAENRGARKVLARVVKDVVRLGARSQCLPLSWIGG